MEFLLVWLEAFVRWLHVIAGVAWIGTSFYFIHLDYSLKARPGLPQGAHGEAWQVHGGGFYHMVKYVVAPARIPDELTWFKWEAYATWFSGLALVVLVYYLGAELYLIDRHVLDVSPPAAIALSVGSLVVAWLAYEFLCRSTLGRNEGLLAAVGFALLLTLAFGFTRVLSGRGAFMQMGAVIGTIMAANVLMVIIPGQRRVVADLLAGRTPDSEYGRRGKQRSLHNNYLTLPVVFVMIANHYPLVFASRWSWLILGLAIVIGAAVRHFYNQRHRGLPSPWWTWAVAALCAAAIVGMSALGPADDRGESRSGAQAPRFAEVEEIVISRCAACHAAEPVWAGIVAAPKGVMLDTPARIRLQRRAIALQAAWTNAMPPGNLTEISSEERAALALWAAATR